MPLLRLLACLTALLMGRAMAQDEAASVALDPVVVTAERRAQNSTDVSASLTGVSRRVLEQAGVTSVKEAAIYAPNVNLVEFTTRAISNPAVRGVGGSTTNPGVTTYIDGVPQLSADTSSRELLDVERIEFVRGAQGTLYGRNTLGGVINQLSRLPGDQAAARAQVDLGNAGRRDFRAVISGPLFKLGSSQLDGTLAAAHTARDGYTLNTFSGERIDGRDATIGQGQLAWRSGAFNAGLILATEDAHDGDFALSDLGGLRSQPFTVTHDFTGETRRRIRSQTVHAGWQGERLSVESISGRVAYSAFETTDLDLTARPDLTRSNQRLGEQWTQEFRLASREPLLRVLGADVQAQAGLFGFRQRNGQNVTNFISAGYLIANGGSFVGLPLVLPIDLSLLNPLAGPAQDRLRANLDDTGYGLYGETTLDWGARDAAVWWQRGWALTLGLRGDREHKRADIAGGTVIPTDGGDLPLSSNSPVQASRDFDAVTPRAILRKSFAAASVQGQLYVSLAEGYRAGGFNPQSPNDANATYGEEHSRNLELGLKTTALNGRVSASVAAYQIKLRDLQLNLPIPNGAGRFYVANVGSATNEGIEVEAQARPIKPLTFFLSLGTLNARFGAGSQDLQGDVSGKRLPYTDPISGTLGAQLVLPAAHGPWTLRAEVQRLGGGYYDPGNTARQSAYTLVNLRAGRRVDGLQLDVFVRNLTNEAAVPLAIPYTGMAPSGFAGENAPPRTVGLSLSVSL